MGKLARNKHSPSDPPVRSDADRRVRQADRLARVLRVLELIQGNGRWNAANLASELECSERTVHRYLDVKKYAGIPISFHAEDACYRVRPGFRFPTLSIRDDQLLDQGIVANLAATPSLSVGEGAKVVAEKIAATSDTQSQKLLEDASHLINILDLKLVDHSRHRDMLRTIQWALIRNQQLSGHYASPYRDRPTRFVLHPYRLCLMRQAWYLIARPTNDDAPRTFRVVRFANLQSEKRTSEVPVEFDIDKYFGNAWGVFRGGTCYDVELQFSKDAATQVTETIWHHTQVVKHHRDGSVTLKFCIDGLDEILWWLLAWTGFVEVIHPGELRQLFVKQLNSGISLNEM